MDSIEHDWLKQLSVIINEFNTHVESTSQWKV